MKLKSWELIFWFIMNTRWTSAAKTPDISDISCFWQLCSNIWNKIFTTGQRNETTLDFIICGDGSFKRWFEMILEIQIQDKELIYWCFQLCFTPWSHPTLTSKTLLKLCPFEDARHFPTSCNLGCTFRLIPERSTWLNYRCVLWCVSIRQRLRESSYKGPGSWRRQHPQLPLRAFNILNHVAFGNPRENAALVTRWRHSRCYAPRNNLTHI